MTSDDYPRKIQTIKREDLEEAFSQLSATEQPLLGRYMGLFGYPHTELEVLAHELNVSCEEVEAMAMEVAKKLGKRAKRTEVVVTRDDSVAAQKLLDRIMSSE